MMTQLKKINQLANRFHQIEGNISQPKFDYSKSSYPHDQTLFLQAEEAYRFITGDYPDYEDDEPGITNYQFFNQPTKFAKDDSD